VDGVILQHVCHVFRIDERIVDADKFGFRIVQGGPKDQAPNPAEAIDAYFR
jgi:hypothetical protein